jgi:hypothetical protein
MHRSTAILTIAAAIGCGSERRQWEIVVENAHTQPCSVNIAYSGRMGSGSASVDGIQPGHTLKLMRGNGSMTVDAVKVKRGDRESTSTPKLRVDEKQFFKLVIRPDDSIIETVEDR